METEGRPARQGNPRTQEDATTVSAENRATPDGNQGLGASGRGKKNALAPVAGGNLVDLAEARQVRSLCVSLVLQAVVSFRSVPRILALLRTEALLGIDWVPHFTSVINWTLRVGLGLLRQVTPIDSSWVAIIDHSIDIGTKKALPVGHNEVDQLGR